jgi:hypothetical protein
MKWVNLIDLIDLIDLIRVPCSLSHSLSQEGRTPLHHASRNGCLDVVRYLIEKCGADVNARDHVSEFDQFVGKLSFDLTVLSLSLSSLIQIRAPFCNAISLFSQMMCVECVECECSQNGRNTPLHCTLFDGHLDVVQFLVEQCGADVHAKDSKKRTALDYCTEYEHARSVAAFLRPYSDRKPKMYALCMGLHRRLGVDSSLNMLNVDVMQEIGKFI